MPFLLLNCAAWLWAAGCCTYLAPPEADMPKMKGPFWVVLVFCLAKWTSIEEEVGLSARRWGLGAVKPR